MNADLHLAIQHIRAADHKLCGAKSKDAFHVEQLDDLPRNTTPGIHLLRARVLINTQLRKLIRQNNQPK